MTIEEQIEFLEDHAEEDLKAMTPKDRMMYYQTIKQFQRAKYQNKPFLDSNQNQTNFTIVYEDRSDKGISGNTESNKTDNSSERRG